MRPPAPLPPRFERAPFTTAEALNAGVTPRRLRSESLVAPHRGVRVDPRRLATTLERCRDLRSDHAARPRLLRADSGRAPRHPAAARARAGSAAPCHLRGRVARTSRAAVSSAARRPPRRAAPGAGAGQRPLTSPADTWCALAATMTRDDLVAAGDRLLGLPTPLCPAEEIDDAIARHGSRRGARALRTARGLLRADVYSRRETFARLTLVRARLPEPEPNGLIVLRSGRRTRGDLVFRRYRVLVEYEGEQHLFDVDQWSTDVARLE